MTDKGEKRYQGIVVDVRVEHVELPNGAELDLEIIEHPGGAASVAVNEDNEVCLVYQYRHVAGGYIWELPAGKIDNREPPVVTAQRELEDEAGVRAVSWFSLGSYLSSPGVFSEVIYLWLARSLTTVEANPDDDEDLEVHWVPFAQALHWALDGTIRDGKSLVGLYRAAHYIELD